MKNNHIASCALLFLFSTAVACSADLKIYSAKEKINSPSGKTVKALEDGAEASGVGYVDFNGNWDLSKNLDFEIDAENLSKTNRVDVRVRLFDDTNRNTGDAIPFFSFSLKPGESAKRVISYPGPIQNKAVAEKMKLMRADPFQHGDKSTFPSDYAKIKTVSVCPAWTNTAPHFKIRSITAKDTSAKKLPKWYSMGEKEFFPFIDKYGQFKFKDWPGKIHSDEDIKKEIAEENKDLEAHKSPDGLDKFGGWAKGPKLEATGHFYVKKIDGKWWMVDPEGRLFWSHGVVRVTPSSAITPLDGRESYFENLPKKGDEFEQFYYTKDELLAPYYTKRGLKKTYDYSAANVYRKYGPQWRSKYAETAHKRLKSWGLNTIANSSDSEIFYMRKTPYIDRFEIHSTPLSGKAAWWPFPDVFNKDFREAVKKQLIERKSQLNDPWCLGFFVDNEIHWGDSTELAKKTILSPKDYAAKKVLMEDLSAEYGTIEKLNAAWKTDFKDWDAFLANCEVPKHAVKEDLEAFTRKMTEEYFKVIRDEIKKLAPNKLYMGCRFAGSNEPLIRLASKYCDVISYNIYRDNLDAVTLPEGVDKPLMIGEFHFGSTDRGPFHPGLIYRENQKERAQAYYDYVRSALRHPNVIGTHWHQFSDQAATGRFDGENFQVGFTDVTDRPYPETIAKIREIGYKLYETRSEK